MQNASRRVGLFRGTHRIGISGLVVEYIVAIDVTRARFPADALSSLFQPNTMLYVFQDCFAHRVVGIFYPLPNSYYLVSSSSWVHSSVVRAADCRSAGPWFKSRCALTFACRIYLLPFRGVESLDPQRHQKKAPLGIEPRTFSLQD